MSARKKVVIKKHLLSLGSIVGGIASIPFVVSCGSYSEGQPPQDPIGRYSYDIELFLTPSQDQLDNGNVSSWSSGNAIQFTSDTLYTKQQIYNSIYSLSSTRAKVVFDWRLSREISRVGNYFYSDIEPINEMISQSIIDLNTFDRITLIIKRFSVVDSQQT